MRFLLITIVVLALPNTGRPGDSLRVATFNINWGNPNLPDIHRAIVAADADVVCLQETNQRSEQFLRHHFQQKYPNIVFQGHQGRYAAERFGIMSKLPLTDVQYVPPVHGLFGTLYCSVLFNERPIRIANAHLSPFGARRGAGFRQVLAAISAVETVHVKEIATLSESLNLTRPTLVCGDFNSLSTFAAPKHLLQLGLTDSFAAVTEMADSQPTWRWPVGKVHVQFRIDYVFHSNHFKTATSTIIPTTGSDHFLVVTEVTLNPQ